MVEQADLASETILPQLRDTPADMHMESLRREDPRTISLTFPWAFSVWVKTLVQSSPPINLMHQYPCYSNAMFLSHQNGFNRRYVAGGTCS